jgi:hypothetical protein
MLSLGFIQSHTTVTAGDLVETVDRNLETAEKLKLYTIILAFQIDDSIYPKYCVVGHTDVDERDRWLHALRFIIERKVELQDGWEQFCRSNTVGEFVKTDEWLRIRSGTARPQLNVAARRKARLQNGKVQRDVPVVFARYSEDCPDWPAPLANEIDPDALIGPRHVMDVSRVVDALAELGLELPPKVREGERERQRRIEGEGQREEGR